MKIFIYIISVIFLLIVIIGGFYWRREYGTEQRVEVDKINKDMSKPEESGGAANSIKIYNQIFKQAMDNEDADKCMEIEDKKQRYLCIKALARNFENKELCAKVIDQALQGECYDDVRHKTAIRTKNLDLCEDINEDRLRDACVIRIITEENYQEQECDNLKGRQKELCLNHVLFALAMRETDPLVCQKMAYPEDKTECVNTVLLELGDSANCELYQDAMRDACISIAANRSAVSRLDEQICYQIKDQAGQDRCVMKVNRLLDSDNDGLSNYQEDIYGADPNNPDTDGDGYLDGEEVKNGFNPNGEGRLEQ